MDKTYDGIKLIFWEIYLLQMFLIWTLLTLFDKYIYCILCYVGCVCWQVMFSTTPQFFIDIYFSTYYVKYLLNAAGQRGRVTKSRHTTPLSARLEWTMAGFICMAGHISFQLCSVNQYIPFYIFLILNR